MDGVGLLTAKNDGNRYIVESDEVLTAFPELEAMLLPSPIMASNPAPKRKQQRVGIGLRLGLRALAAAISGSLRPPEKRQANIL